jgi:hypothetical protein
VLGLRRKPLLYAALLQILVFVLVTISVFKSKPILYIIKFPNPFPYDIYPKTLPLRFKHTSQCPSQYACAHISIVEYAIHTIHRLIYIQLRTWVVGTPTQLQCL